MVWRALTDADTGRENRPSVLRRTRVLVDESLGPEVTEFLREKRFNVIYAGDVGLLGRSDEDVFAFAWRERRMLWTHDRDFLDDGRFPEHRNPGVVVLAGADGNQIAMVTALVVAVLVFGRHPDQWRRTKSVVGADGELQIRQREFDTGRIKTSRYRLPRRGPAQIWVD